jgi:hypothetical protein
MEPRLAKVLIVATTILVILILGPLLWFRGGTVGLAGLLIATWAVLMIYLVVLIGVRLRRGMQSEKRRFHTQMAQFLAQTREQGNCTRANSHDQNRSAKRR